MRDILERIRPNSRDELHCTTRLIKPHQHATQPKQISCHLRHRRRRRIRLRLIREQQRLDRLDRISGTSFGTNDSQVTSSGIVHIVVGVEAGDPELEQVEAGGAGVLSAEYAGALGELAGAQYVVGTGAGDELRVAEYGFILGHAGDGEVAEVEALVWDGDPVVGVWSGGYVVKLEQRGQSQGQHSASLIYLR